MNPLVYLRSFGLFTSEDGGYDIPQKPLAPHECIGCERLVLEIERNLSLGRESCLLCTECGCIMKSKNYDRHINTFHQKQEDKEMLAKLDNGNAVLFSEVKYIGLVNVLDADNNQVMIATKGDNHIHGEMRPVFIATKERDRLIGEWEAWLKGGIE